MFKIIILNIYLILKIILNIYQQIISNSYIKNHSNHELLLFSIFFIESYSFCFFKKFFFQSVILIINYFYIILIGFISSLFHILRKSCNDRSILVFLIITPTFFNTLRENYYQRYLIFSSAYKKHEWYLFIVNVEVEDQFHQLQKLYQVILKSNWSIIIDK